MAGVLPTVIPTNCSEEESRSPLCADVGGTKNEIPHSLRPFGMTDCRMTGVLPTVIPPLRSDGKESRAETSGRKRSHLYCAQAQVGQGAFWLVGAIYGLVCRIS
jgi:hypothetical protein